MQSQSGKQLFSPTHRLIKDRECFLLTVIVKSPETESYSIDPVLSSIETPLKLCFSVQKIRQNEDSKSLCLDKSTLKFPLTLRKWKQSDYFYPNGMKGRKKLSKYFKDEKFSLVEKESQWLLCSGEDIVWVIGKRADQRFLAHAGTEKKWFIRYDD
jgi:tRNA(Ile)-lysidine synthase